MKTPIRLALLSVVFLGAACGLAQERPGPADRDEPRFSAELFVVARNTTLLNKSGDPDTLVARLKPGDLVRTVPTTETAPRGMRRVVLVDSRATPLEGWVDIRECFYFHTDRNSLKNLPRPAAPTDDVPAELPELIRRASPALQQTYRDVAVIIKRNEELGKRLPEPYFLLGRLWMEVKNYDAAARAYLTGAALVKERRLDETRYAIYYEQLHQALRAFNRRPRPRPLDEDGADYHYEQGRQAFWSKQCRRALWYFDDAVALNSSEPLYWYYRGLTHLAMGNERRASYDVRVGADLEKIKRRRKESIDYLLRALERLQGPQRLWLNQIRKGDHEAR
jgi:hypothetical protein